MSLLEIVRVADSTEHVLRLVELAKQRDEADDEFITEARAVWHRLRAYETAPNRANAVEMSTYYVSLARVYVAFIDAKAWNSPDASFVRMQLREAGITHDVLKTMPVWG